MAVKGAPVIIIYFEEKNPFLIRFVMIKNSFHLYSHTQFIIKQKHRYPKSSKKRTPDLKYIFFYLDLRMGFPATLSELLKLLKQKASVLMWGAPDLAVLTAGLL